MFAHGFAREAIHLETLTGLDGDRGRAGALVRRDIHSPQLRDLEDLADRLVAAAPALRAAPRFGFFGVGVGAFAPVTSLLP